MTDQPAAPRSAPDFLHELFWGQISALLGDELQRYQPSMGTVDGATGAYLLVLPDGSAVPRKMAHLAGRRFRIGDRVIFGPVKGQPVVYGGVLTATGAVGEGVVSSIDLDPQINATLVSFQSTLTNHEGRITTAQNTAANALTAANTAQNTADTAKSTANSAQTAAGNAASAASAAQSSATAADAHAQNVYNLLNVPANNGQQALDRLQTNINLRMDTVCRKACGNNACNPCA